MNVEIVKVDKSLPLPEYKTEGAVAFDFFVRKKTLVPAGKIVLVPTGVIIKVPEGFGLAVVARSSTGRKKNILVPFGLVDNDYYGPEDEIFLQAYNIGEKDCVLERGDRVAQGIFVQLAKAQWVEKKSAIKKQSRGTGSTG